MTSPETAAKADAGECGHSIKRAGCSERKSPRHGPSRQLDLEAVVAGGLCRCQRRFSSAMEQRVISRFCRARSFPPRFAGSPRFHGNATEREACFNDRIVLDAQRRCG